MMKRYIALLLVLLLAAYWVFPVCAAEDKEEKRCVVFHL